MRRPLESRARPPQDTIRNILHPTERGAEEGARIRPRTNVREQGARPHAPTVPHFLPHFNMRRTVGKPVRGRKPPSSKAGNPAKPLARKACIPYTIGMGLWERFYSKVAEDGNGCWVWQGALDRDGYGRIGYEGRTFAAHRISYRQWVRPIPSWLQLDHLCRNPSCVNPAHLEAVTCATNIQRGDTGRWIRERQLPLRLLFPRPVRTRQLRLRLRQPRQRPTHCTANHPLSGDNLIIRSDNGGRRCRTCQLERVRDWRRRQKVA